MGNKHESILQLQKEYFLSDVTKSFEWRVDQLDRMERMLKENDSEFCDALYRDFQKPEIEQQFEIITPLKVIKYYRDNLRMLMEPEPVDIPGGLIETGNNGFIHKEPFGTTLIIGPFNAPVLLLLDPAIAALSAGNTVILKPANTTRNVSSLFEKLIPKYFNPEAVSVVTGGRQEISALLELPFDFIFFTGSTTVGKIVMRAAAEHLTPVILELGGQNPTVVDETANLDTATDRIAWGHNAISGQWCVAPGYVYIQESIADHFIEKLKSALVKMYGEDPEKSPDFARMISEKEAKRVASYILPEKVVHGGRFNLKKRFIEPTVLYPSSWDDPALQQEIFGPVLPVLKFNKLENVIDTIKTKPKPLAAYIFSKDESAISLFLSSLSFGGGCVNQTNIHSLIESLPFGGVGLSGIGKYYGKAGFDALSNKKSILVGNPDVELDLFPPYKNKDIGENLKVLS